MEDLGQISLLPDLEEEIEEEDRIRLREEEDLVEALLFPWDVPFLQRKLLFA